MIRSISIYDLINIDQFNLIGKLGCQHTFVPNNTRMFLRDTWVSSKLFMVPVCSSVPYWYSPSSIYWLLSCIQGMVLKSQTLESVQLKSFEDHAQESIKELLLRWLITTLAKDLVHILSWVNYLNLSEGEWFHIGHSIILMILMTYPTCATIESSGEIHLTQSKHITCIIGCLWCLRSKDHQYCDDMSWPGWLR